MERPIGFAAAVVLVLCAACSSGGRAGPSWTNSPPPSLFMQAWSPAPGQECAVATERPLPALDAMFDSAAVTRALQAVPDSGTVVYSVAIHRPEEQVRDPIDSVRVRERIDTARIVETTLPEETARRIAEVLRQNVRPSVRGGFLLRIDSPGPRFRRAQSIGCLPAVRNVDEIQRRLRSAAQEGLHGTAVVDISIREDGSVERATVRQSSGDLGVDRAIAGIAEAMEFHPFLVNRIPTAFVLTTPLAIGR
jgi:TonB family protein